MRFSLEPSPEPLRRRATKAAVILALGLALGAAALALIARISPMSLVDF